MLLFPSNETFQILICCLEKFVKLVNVNSNMCEKLSVMKEKQLISFVNISGLCEPYRDFTIFV